MIIIPRLLIEQLRLAEGPLQRELALTFGEHVTDVCGGAFDTTEPLRALLETSRRFLAGTQTIADVDAERLKFLDWKNGLDRSAINIALTIQLAMVASCGDELDEYGAEKYWRARGETPPSSPPITVIDVARDAQRVIARWTTRSQDDDAKATSRAQWEEARWQLIRTIESTPNPHTR